MRPSRGCRGQPGTDPRRLRLFVQEGARRGAAPRTMGYVLQSGDAPRSDSVQIPGPTLVLTRGRPADMTAINRPREPTSVHRHRLDIGMESAAAAGWSGLGRPIAHRSP